MLTPRRRISNESLICYLVLDPIASVLAFRFVLSTFSTRKLQVAIQSEICRSYYNDEGQITRKILDDVNRHCMYMTDTRLTNSLAHGFLVGWCVLFLYHVYKGMNVY